MPVYLMVKTIKPEAAAEISQQTGIPVEDLPEFDGKAWWWFPPPKLVIEVAAPPAA